MYAATRNLPLLIGTITGCAQTPSAPFREPALQVTTDQRVRVTAPTFQLDFAAVGVRMPERLMVNGVDVLGVDLPCQGESRVGLRVAPAVQASAGSTDDHSEITVLAAGPAMAKIRVEYELDYNCPNQEWMTGTTEFTIFASGRIVREDIAVKPSTNALGLVGQCGCQDETNVLNYRPLAFSSFWAFHPTEATQVDERGTAIEIGASAAASIYKACTMYRQHAIGVAWAEPAVQGATRTAFHSQAAASHSLHFPTENAGQMLLASPQSITSAIQISSVAPAQHSDCAAILGRLADVPLTIGSERFDYSDHDGIYRDPASHSGAFDIVAHEVAVPSGFAISVDLGGANHAVITRHGEAEPAAVVQRETGTRFIIAFQDGLAPGERLTIEPRS